jgi:hypothetical protein
MSFYDIYRQESHPTAVLLVEFVEGGNLPPEGRSSVAAEYQDDWLLCQHAG